MPCCGTLKNGLPQNVLQSYQLCMVQLEEEMILLPSNNNSTKYTSLFEMYFTTFYGNSSRGARKNL